MKIKGRYPVSAQQRPSFIRAMRRLVEPQLGNVSIHVCAVTHIRDRLVRAYLSCFLNEDPRAVASLQPWAEN